MLLPTPMLVLVQQLCRDWNRPTDPSPVAPCPCRGTRTQALLWPLFVRQKKKLPPLFFLSGWVKGSWVRCRSGRTPERNGSTASQTEHKSRSLAALPLLGGWVGEMQNATSANDLETNWPRTKVHRKLKHSRGNHSTLGHEPNGKKTSSTLVATIQHLATNQMQRR